MKSILIVDDQQVNRLLLAQMFREQYNIFEAANGQEALDIIQVEDIGVVLLDLKMPVMDGFEFLQHIRQDSRLVNTPVLIISGYTDEEMKRKAFDCGANNIFFKPFNREFLLKTVTDYFSLGEQSNQRAYFENIYRTLPVGIMHFAKDNNGRMINANEQAVKLLGYKKEEFFQERRRFHDHIIPEDLPKVRQKMKEVARLQIGETCYMEYGIAYTDGHIGWVSELVQPIYDSFGVPVYQCVVTDITEQKRLQLELTVSENRYRLILSKTKGMVFEWDYQTKKVTYYTSKFNELRAGVSEENFPEHLRELGIIYPEDWERFAAVFEAYEKGQLVAEEEVRVKNVKGVYIWCRLDTVGIFDNNRKLLKVVGLLDNIDELKKEVTLAQWEAKSDALTGLYNRKAFEKFIDQALEQKSEATLYVIDLDNFKKINDTYGHIAGDEAIVAAAEALKHIFRESDYIARMGGDEFAVLLHGTKNLAVVKAKAKNIIESIAAIQVDSHQQVFLSASVGIIRFDAEHTTFDSVYHCADSEMYSAKRNGKNSYKIYQEEVEEVLVAADEC